MSENYKFDTLSLHAGHIPDKETGSRAVPIYQTTSYVFKSTEDAASLYNMEIGGHLYTRISNPTVAALEQRLAACILDMEVNSSYIWENQNQQEREVLVLFKTNQTSFEKLEQYISTNHPYEIPSILKIDASANQDYQKWIDSIIS